MPLNRNQRKLQAKGGWDTKILKGGKRKAYARDFRFAEKTQGHTGEKVDAIKHFVNAFNDGIQKHDKKDDADKAKRYAAMYEYKDKHGNIKFHSSKTYMIGEEYEGPETNTFGSDDTDAEEAWQGQDIIGVKIYLFNY